MSYTDLYLRFDNEDQADSLLYTPNPISGDMIQNYQNIDTLGILYEDPEYDEEGNVTEDPIPLEGWHVNVRALTGEDIDPLLEFTVEPEHPRRVWG